MPRSSAAEFEGLAVLIPRVSQQSRVSLGSRSFQGSGVRFMVHTICVSGFQMRPVRICGLMFSFQV